MGRKRTDLSEVMDQWPAVNTLDWEKVFTEDPFLYGRVWNDILKFDQANDGKPGPRPALDPHIAFKRWMQLSGDDFSGLPFREALSLISNNASNRRIAERTGLDRNTVQRLMAGTMQPDAYEMELCAIAYGRQPAYFLEWRIGFILKMVHTHMMKYPESSVGPYRKVRDALGKKD